EPRHRGDEPVIALAEGAEQTLVALGEPRRQRVLDPGEERPLRGDAANEGERVVRDADERRGEHGDDRLVVVAVLEEPQVREHVDDLLLAEVALAGGAVGRQPGAPQLLLVPLGVRPGREEEDDLTRRRRARVDELAHATRHRARLAAPPVRAAVLVALLVGDEELDRMAEDRIGELGRGGEILELVAEVRAEQVIDRGEYLRPRAVVERQREVLLRLLASLPEDLDVGVAEAVDRLELVPDEEELRVRRAEQLDDLRLEPVRVLELVDEDRPEARLLALADLGPMPEQVARLELEILEVERRLARLRLRVLPGEGREQLLEECPVAGGGLVEPGLRDRRERVAVGGRAVAARLERREAHEPVRPGVPLQQLEQRRRGPRLRLGRARIGRERARRRAELLDPLRELGTRRDCEVELAARRAQRLVDGREHPPQARAPVRREQLEPLRVAAREELRERRAERLRAQDGGLRVVELPEARIETRGERIRLQQAVAEAVDRRDPGAVELAREILPAALGERRADPRAQLPGRAPRVRDDEDRVDVEAPVADGANDALDENRRLPRPGAGGDEDLPGRLHGRELLLVERMPAHARSTRHIGQRSHHCGHSPPRGSWWTSPSRIRPASADAVDFADSTTPQNASSSR